MTDVEKIRFLESDARYWREEAEKAALKALAFLKQAEAIRDAAEGTPSASHLDDHADEQKAKEATTFWWAGIGM
jgi:hypothetical protein